MQDVAGSSGTNGYLASSRDTSDDDDDDYSVLSSVLPDVLTMQRGRMQRIYRGLHGALKEVDDDVRGVDNANVLRATAAGSLAPQTIALGRRNRAKKSRKTVRRSPFLWSTKPPSRVDIAHVNPASRSQ